MNEWTNKQKIKIKKQQHKQLRKQWLRNSRTKKISDKKKRKKKVLKNVTQGEIND